MHGERLLSKFDSRAQQSLQDAAQTAAAAIFHGQQRIIHNEQYSADELVVGAGQSNRPHNVNGRGVQLVPFAQLAHGQRPWCRCAKSIRRRDDLTAAESIRRA